MLNDLEDSKDIIETDLIKEAVLQIFESTPQHFNDLSDELDQASGSNHGQSTNVVDRQTTDCKTPLIFYPLQTQKEARHLVTCLQKHNIWTEQLCRLTNQSIHNFFQWKSGKGRPWIGIRLMAVINDIIESIFEEVSTDDVVQFESQTAQDECRKEETIKNGNCNRKKISIRKVHKRRSQMKISKEEELKQPLIYNESKIATQATVYNEMPGNRTSTNEEKLLSSHQTFTKNNDVKKENAPVNENITAKLYVPVKLSQENEIKTTKISFPSALLIQNCDKITSTDRASEGLTSKKKIADETCRNNKPQLIGGDTGEINFNKLTKPHTCEDRTDTSNNSSFKKEAGDEEFIRDDFQKDGCKIKQEDTNEKVDVGCRDIITSPNPNKCYEDDQTTYFSQISKKEEECGIGPNKIKFLIAKFNSCEPPTNDYKLARRAINENRVQPFRRFVLGNISQRYVAKPSADQQSKLIDFKNEFVTSNESKVNNYRKNIDLRQTNDKKNLPISNNNEPTAFQRFVSGNLSIRSTPVTRSNKNDWGEERKQQATMYAQPEINKPSLTPKNNEQIIPNSFASSSCNTPNFKKSSSTDREPIKLNSFLSSNFMSESCQDFMSNQKKLIARPSQGSFMAEAVGLQAYTPTKDKTWRHQITHSISNCTRIKSSNTFSTDTRRLSSEKILGNNNIEYTSNNIKNANINKNNNVDSKSYKFMNKPLSWSMNEHKISSSDGNKLTQPTNKTTQSDEAPSNKNHFVTRHNEDYQKSLHIHNRHSCGNSQVSEITKPPITANKQAETISANKKNINFTQNSHINKNNSREMYANNYNEPNKHRSQNKDSIKYASYTPSIRTNNVNAKRLHDSNEKTNLKKTHSQKVNDLIRKFNNFKSEFMFESSALKWNI
ncbi:hypothetical protein HELRODRAFT_191466 [Helobdella robusta]|uniref:Uncharacterized protein n=1 Tax=Helobdella robusta TaxID=6412 RepID=T1FT04_HELRO|nr:hypothetical protein HELRODRAFT_191466 [Helobdella robusta]ESO05401.1 hypothetical protein HELRODRAFT_191466 [Helobdella robusta]